MTFFIKVGSRRRWTSLREKWGWGN